MKEMSKMMKTLVKNQNQQMANHVTQLNQIQNRLVMMEINQVFHAPRKFQHKPNQMYQKKAPAQEPRMSNWLDSTNMVEDAIPFCRPYDQFHQESTRYIANQVMEHGFPETSNQDVLSSEPEFVNMVGQTYPLSNQHWQQAIEYSQEKDFNSQNYGEKLYQEQVKEMRDARFKGATYQRKAKSTPTKQYKHKVTTPPIMNPLLLKKQNLTWGCG